MNRPVFQLKFILTFVVAFCILSLLAFLLTFEHFHFACKQFANHSYAKVILFWSKHWNRKHPPECGLKEAPERCRQQFPKCYLTSDRRYTGTADAFIVHWPDATSELVPSSPSAPLILYTLESPLSIASYNVRLPSEQRHILFASYWKQSDIYVPYGSVQYSPDELDVDLSSIKSERPRAVAWIVSNCYTPSRREDYVFHLKQFIQVDVYGDCGDYECDGQSEDCLRNISPLYYFYLAFENSLCLDYATEKIFRALKTDIVPIVYGRANYSTLLPPHSFIDATDLSPELLADKLRFLILNPNEYRKFFQWKRHWTIRTENYDDTLHCGICEYLNKTDSEKASFFLKTSEEVVRLWNGVTFCRDKRMEKPLSRLVIDKKVIALFGSVILLFVLFIVRRRIKRCTKRLL